MADIAELVDIVLTGQHPRLRERCLVDRISSVFEDHFGVYDSAGVRTLLADRRAEVDAKLTEAGAAPPVFLSLLVAHVNGAAGAAASPSAGSSAAGSSVAGSSSAEKTVPEKPQTPAAPKLCKQVGLGHFFGGGTMVNQRKGAVTIGAPISAEDLAKVDALKSFPCSQCGKAFGNSGARSTHQRTCKVVVPSAPADAAAAATASAAAAGLSEEATALFAAAAATAAAAAAQPSTAEDEEVQPPPGKAPKLRKPWQTKAVGTDARRYTHGAYTLLQARGRQDPPPLPAAREDGCRAWHVAWCRSGDLVRLQRSRAQQH